MSMRWMTLFAVGFFALLVEAQINPARAKYVDIQVSPARPWTDALLDLQPGDVIKITARSTASPDASSRTPVCDPGKPVEEGGKHASLPLPSATPGALIAKLHGENDTPILVGASRELHIDKPSHLLLGMNLSAIPTCYGGFAVRIERIPAGKSAITARDANNETGVDTTPKGV
jgi:hypothetical protein